MAPTIYVLGLNISTYALMAFLGFVAFVIYLFAVVMREKRYDMGFCLGILGVSAVGAVVLYVGALGFDILFMSIERGKLSVGSITWLGGIIFVILLLPTVIHFLVPKDKGCALDRLSTMMPGVVLAHTFGRVGCFFAGCCHGEPTDSFLGVVFPAGSSAGRLYPDYLSQDYVVSEAGQFFYPSVPVLPTQLIEAGFELLLCIVMLALYKKLKHCNIEIYCFAYGAFRFALEFIRGDTRGETGLFLTPSQLMSIILWIIAILIILYKKNILFKKTYAKSEQWREEAEPKS